jgi:hypothetical protein
MGIVRGGGEESTQTRLRKICRQANAILKQNKKPPGARCAARAWGREAWLASSPLICNMALTAKEVRNKYMAREKGERGGTIADRKSTRLNSSHEGSAN